MRTRAFSIVFVIAALAGAPNAAMSQIYKWVEADGSVHYGDTAPRTKSARVVGNDSGTLSVVPGMSKEEKERLRVREDQLRLQRLEREVEELRSREQARAYAQPEVIYAETYVPAYGYGLPLHHRNFGDVKPRPDHPIAKVGPPQRTPAVDDLNFTRVPTGSLSRR